MEAVRHLCTLAKKATTEEREPEAEESDLGVCPICLQQPERHGEVWTTFPCPTSAWAPYALHADCAQQAEKPITSCPHCRREGEAKTQLVYQRRRPSEYIDAPLVLAVNATIGTIDTLHSAIQREGIIVRVLACSLFTGERLCPLDPALKIPARP